MSYLTPLFLPRYKDPVGNSVARRLDQIEEPITGMTTPERLRATSLKWRRDNPVLTARLEKRQADAAAARRYNDKRREQHERFEVWLNEQKDVGLPLNLTDINAWIRTSAA
jgi:hypothetical protein